MKGTRSEGWLNPVHSTSTLWDPRTTTEDPVTIVAAYLCHTQRTEGGHQINTTRLPYTLHGTSIFNLLFLNRYV